MNQPPQKKKQSTNGINSTQTLRKKQSILRDSSNHLLRMVSWNLNTLRFGGDCTPLAHPLTFGNWISREWMKHQGAFFQTYFHQAPLPSRLGRSLSVLQTPPKRRRMLVNLCLDKLRWQYGQKIVDSYISYYSHVSFPECLC